MTPLIVHVEGKTEREFVESLLKPHLEAFGVWVKATLVGKMIAHRRGHSHRGGGHYRNWKRDILRTLASDSRSTLRVSTLFDLYGLPDDFPGLREHGAERNTLRRCDELQAALNTDLGDDPRFIPYIQRHEVEALVLASLDGLRQVLDAEDELAGLAKLAAETAGLAPEDINDGNATAPSKRLERAIPGYQKPLHGPMAIHVVGFPTVRGQCPRFNAWLKKLEQLGGQQAAV